MHRIVAVNANPAILEVFVDCGFTSEIVSTTDEAELHAYLSDRTDVVALGFEPSKLSP